MKISAAYARVTAMMTPSVKAILSASREMQMKPSPGAVAPKTIAQRQTFVMIPTGMTLPPRLPLHLLQ